MTQTLVTVAAFLLLLTLAPFGVKWVQARSSGSGGMPDGSSKILSAIAVGPQQRVVTIEVGSADSRVCLVLGVTAQSISCLHAIALKSPAFDATRDALVDPVPRA